MAILGTQSLAQLVRARPEVGGPVDLSETFQDPALSARRLQAFAPLSPQLRALQALASTASGGGSLLLAGPQGTGKSLLLALFARALQVDYPSETFSALCERVAEAGVVKALGGLRSAGKRWLVVLPRLGEHEDLASSVRRALTGALFTQGVSEFTPDPESSLAEALSRTTEALAGRGDFQGIALLFDAAEELVAELLEEGGACEDLQEVSCQGRVSALPWLLAVAMDREISQLSPLEESRLVELFDRVQPVGLLGRMGEWEELVADLLSHPDPVLWEAVRSHPDLRAVRETTSRTGLYRGVSERWLTGIAVEGAYPLHPAALFALPRLAARLAAGGRTAFSLFSDSSPGGFQYFLQNFAASQPNGRLSLYTADLLFTHFEKAMQEDPVHRPSLEAFQKAALSAGDVPQARRLLRAILIFQLVGHDRLRPRAEELVWALHLGEREAVAAHQSLELLVQKGALRFAEASREYLLPVEERGAELESALARARLRVRGDLDLVGTLERQVRLPSLEARRFNELHGSDRFATSRLIRAHELLVPGAVEALMDRGLGRVRPYRGDLLVGWVLAEGEEERRALLGRIASGDLAHPRLLLALPLQARGLAAEVLEVRALEALRGSGPPFSDPTSGEHEEVGRRLEAATLQLREQIQGSLQLEAFEFHGPGLAAARLDQEALQEWVDARLEALLGRPPALGDPVFTCLKDPGRARRQRQVALNLLLGSGGELVLSPGWGRPADILRAGLVDTGIVVEAGGGGELRRYRPAEPLPAAGLGAALAALEGRLWGAPGGERVVEAAELVQALLAPPHSLTPAMVELLLAVSLWKGREVLSLHRGVERARAQGREELLRGVPASAEALFELVGHPSDWVIRYQDAGPEARRFLEGLRDWLGGGEGPAPERSLWETVARQLKARFEALPWAARAAGAAAGSSTAPWVRLLGRTSRTEGGRALLGASLPVALGAPPEDPWAQGAAPLLASLIEGFEELEGLVEQRRRALERGLEGVFAAPAGGDGALGWVARARRWLAGLDPLEASALCRTELDLLSELLGREPVGTHELVEALGLPPLEGWGHDATQELLERLSALREEVEWGLYRGRASGPPPSSAEGVLAAVRPVLLRASLPPEELEGWLLRELERVTWPDLLARSATDPVFELPGTDPAEGPLRAPWLLEDPAQGPPSPPARQEGGAERPADPTQEPTLGWL